MKNYNLLFVILGVLGLFFGKYYWNEQLTPEADQLVLLSDSIRIVDIDVEELTSIDWTGANGRRQVIQKVDAIWHYAGMEAVDYISFHSYLTGLVNAIGYTFDTRSSIDGLTAQEKLTLYGNTMKAPTIITTYLSKDPLKPVLIHSSANSETVFTSDSIGLYKIIFSDLRQFWPNGQ